MSSGPLSQDQINFVRNIKIKFKNLIRISKFKEDCIDRILFVSIKVKQTILSSILSSNNLPKILFLLLELLKEDHLPLLPNCFISMSLVVEEICSCHDIAEIPPKVGIKHQSINPN
jgi:hypothetical protein